MVTSLLALMTGRARNLNMKYKLTSIEVKAGKSGKSFATTFWNDGQGEQKALMFKDYETLKVGDEVEGRISPWKDAFVFNVGEANTYVKGPSGYKSIQIDAAMDKKAENVEKAQDRTSHGVRIAAAFRDATLIGIEIMKREEMSLDEYKALHKRLREWYLHEWQSANDQPFF